MQNNTTQLREPPKWFSQRPSNSLPSNAATIPNSETNDDPIIEIVFGEDNVLPEQDPSVFWKVNPLGKRIQDQFPTSLAIPLDYELGFRTIADYISYSGMRDCVYVDQIIYTMHNLSGGSFGMKSISGELYQKNKNKQFVNITQIINHLLQDGFVKKQDDDERVDFFKFSENNLPVEHVHIRKKGRVSSYLLQGIVKKNNFDKIKELIEPYMESINNHVIVQQLDTFQQDRMSGGLQPVFSNNKLTNDMDCAHPEFYPWIKMDLMDYFREFFKSKANALVLIGEPGTGKSTLIRTVIRELNVRAMLAYKQDVITSSEFVGACRDFLNRSNYDPENDITKQTQAIVVEDADLIMRRRMDGNTQMAELLNATSGITSNIGHKFIMSTNLKTIDDIDPALLRPGRCFDILCFRSLSADEATLVRQVRGLEPREFSKANRYKLAEVLNDVITQHQVEPIVKPRFGF